MPQDDFTDFDEHTLPEKGVIRRVMRQNGCSWTEALAAMDIAPEEVTFRELDIGDRFRLNSFHMEKIAPRSTSWYGHTITFTARIVGDDLGEVETAGRDTVSVADSKLVQPLYKDARDR